MYHVHFSRLWIRKYPICLRKMLYLVSVTVVEANHTEHNHVNASMSEKKQFHLVIVAMIE